MGQEAEQITAHHHLGLALISHERGDDDGRSQALANRRRPGPTHHPGGLAPSLESGPGPAQRIRRGMGCGARTARRSQARLRQNRVPMLQPVEAHKARIYLKQGRLDKAQAWARERGFVGQLTKSVIWASSNYLTLVRVRLAEGSFTGVNDLLERLLALAETQKRMGSVIEILLTQALVHQAQGNHPQALATLERALTLAKPEGYLRIFVDEGEAMRLLISDFRSTDDDSTPRSPFAWIC